MSFRKIIIAGTAVGVALTSLGSPPTAHSVPLSMAATAAAAPTADLLDVDFGEGEAADAARERTVTTYGSPEFYNSEELQRSAVAFDGNSAFSYPLTMDDYDQLADSLSFECTFRYDDLPGGWVTICGNKEEGGFGLTSRRTEVGFQIHTGDSMKVEWVPIQPDRWYHAVGTYDGESANLYLNGELAASASVGGPVNVPVDEDALHWAVGADSAPNDVELEATVDMASSKLFSDALTPNDVLALYADFQSDVDLSIPALNSSTPADGGYLTEATRLELNWDKPELLGEGIVYELDGVEVRPGDIIGAGMEAGRHTLSITGTTVYGQPVDTQVIFDSPDIPAGEGTDTFQGEGAATLAAQATNPTGGDVRTTFYEDIVDVANGGFEGTVEEFPSTLEFDFDGAAFDDAGESPIATPGEIPFQRFDVELDNALDDQTVRWSGRIDPAREANLHVWSTESEAWDELDSARGISGTDIILDANIDDAHVLDGTVHVMVTGLDPFADDINAPVRDSFEDPGDYDFSMVHFTDTQYLSDRAFRFDISDEQRDVWLDAYTTIPEWIVENADERKIEYVAHTGDVIENWINTNITDERIERAEHEYEFASMAQNILDASEIPNGVLPGNHDNLAGEDEGPEAMFNDYFGPERYEALENTQGWQDANASYHAWAEGDNSNHYDLFSAGGLDFIAVYLGYGVNDEEIAWANEVLAEHPDRNAMVMTHSYNQDSIAPDGRGTREKTTDGARISEQILTQNDNVFLVLSGHIHGVSIDVRTDVGTEGNNVVELLANYQRYTMSAEELGLAGVDGLLPNQQLTLGSSFLRLLQFDVDAGVMSVDTYSPLLDNFGATEYDGQARYNGEEDDFAVPVQLTSRTTSFETDTVVVTAPTDTIIGEATAKSNWPATVEWTGLEQGQVYAWYAMSRDAQTDAELPGRSVQLGVFTAEDAGTDTIAPELTVPDSSTITAGDSFDPMNGVSATDNVDGDITENVQVIGSVDTSTPGVYTLNYLVEDSSGNQASASISVTVVAEDETPGAQPGDQTGGGQQGNEESVNSPTTPGDETDGSQQKDGSEETAQSDASEQLANDKDNNDNLANTGTNTALMLSLIAVALLAIGIAIRIRSQRQRA